MGFLAVGVMGCLRCELSGRVEAGLDLALGVELGRCGFVHICDRGLGMYVLVLFLYAYALSHPLLS